MDDNQGQAANPNPPPPNRSPLPQGAPVQAAADEPVEITELVYMPGPGDADTTTVDTVEFKAYEPVKLPAGRAYLGGKLHANPFFSSTHDMKKDHEDRKKAWEAARDAKKKRDDAQAEVDKLDKAAAAS